MRVLCERYGAQRTYTEMVNAEGLYRGSEKTAFLLEVFPEEQHVWAHLYGADPDRLAEAAKRVEALGRFEGIDLNAGCPVPRITAQGAGAALLHDLPRLGRIVKAVSRAVRLPVSLKTRLGPNPNVQTWRETLRLAEDAGLSAIRGCRGGVASRLWEWIGGRFCLGARHGRNGRAGVAHCACRAR